MALCGYSARHASEGIEATTTITMPYGDVDACGACAAFYERMSAHREATSPTNRRSQ